MIQRPSEFIAFLRRRTDPETVTHYRGVDELDFLIAFIGGGLRLDDLENQTYLRFPASRGASATAGDNDNDTATQGLLASHTDPLDAWYRYKHGKRSEPAARPELRIDPRCREVIDALAKRREPGWLSTGAILVDQDVASQERIIGRINDAIAQPGSGDVSCVSWHVDNGPEPSRCVLVFRAVEDAEQRSGRNGRTRQLRQLHETPGADCRRRRPHVRRRRTGGAQRQLLRQPPTLPSLGGNPLAKLCIEGLVLWRVFLATRLALRRHPPAASGAAGTGAVR